jgi:TolB-like protein/tetratricopeptide (TPR) repeat protein
MAASNDPSESTGTLNPEQAAQVREHLEEILASSAFSGGKRAQEFLKLVTGHMIAGRSDSLKERMIGAEMFGRPVDYDTANDAVVRVKANEVRRRLAQFYLERGGPLPLQIELPLGSYIPRVIWTSTDKVGDGAASVNQKRLSTRALRAWSLLLLGAGVAAGLGVYVYQRAGTQVDSPIRSIAILPLTNLSGDANQDYFADGMTEELTAELGKVPALRVISRTSAMTYKGTTKKLPQIAHELGVEGIIEGSIEREGNRVRVTTQLVDARSDRHLWAQTYDRDLTSVLEVESQVARAVSEEIRVELTPEQRAHFERTQRIDPQSLELYMQGIQRLNQGDPRSAMPILRQAVEKDSNNAAAHAALAHAYGWMGEAGWMSYGEAFSHEKEEAQKAIELDDTRPEPHIDLGVAAMNQSWDWSTQKKEFLRALELGPNAATVRWAYANYLNRVGLVDEAVMQAKAALVLDPVSGPAYVNMSFMHYFARQYDEALKNLKQAEAMHTASTMTMFPFGTIYVEKGEYQLAIQNFQQMGNVPHALGHLGNAYARQGRKAEARALIPKLKEHVDKIGVGRYEMALIYAGLNDKDAAFEWLERAYQVRDKGLTYLRVDPLLDPLRSDARFESLLKRVAFPAASGEKTASTGAGKTRSDSRARLSSISERRELRGVGSGAGGLKAQ